MKKIAILSLVIFCAVPLHAQGRAMYIYLTNGQRLVFDTGSISEMTFTPAGLPKYDAMNVFTQYSIPSPDVHYTTDIDSIIFGYKNQTAYIAIYDSTRGPAPGFPYAYPIDTAHGVDSITFSQFENDTNVLQLSNYYWDSITGNGANEIGYYWCAVWRGSRIYAAWPLKYFDLDSNYTAVLDSTVYPMPKGRILFLNENKAGSTLLFVQTRGGDVSLGSLYEYDIQNNSVLKVPLDDSNVSSAVFCGSDSIIYYTYGSYTDTNTNPPDAGYYLLNARTGTKTLLLPMISDLGPGEMVNGFDVSPDGKTLLVTSTGNNRPPLLIEYNLVMHTLDTMKIEFGPSDTRWGLWVRYNHDGTKIAYSNYPIESFGYEVSDITEVGIIDKTTGSKRILNMSPTNEGLWLNVFPEWSPDGLKLIYGSAPISTEPPGHVGQYKVCILKTLQ